MPGSPSENQATLSRVHPEALTPVPERTAIGAQIPIRLDFEMSPRP